MKRSTLALFAVVAFAIAAAAVTGMGRSGTAQAATDPLVSQGKAATASSYENPAGTSCTNSGGCTPGKADDGNTATRWASAAGSDPQWITIDLGSNYNISRVRLNWEAAYAKGYKIQVSKDGSTWTDAYSTSTGDGGVDDLTSISASGRYVRMYGTSRATSWGYSLWEFEVYC
jgi:endoglucanase